MTEYWGASRIAAQLGVATGTITKWIDRFADTASPFPVPDVEIAETDGRVTRGWSPRRWPEIKEWVTRDRYEVRRGERRGVQKRVTFNHDVDTRYTAALTGRTSQPGPTPR